MFSQSKSIYYHCNFEFFLIVKKQCQLVVHEMGKIAEGTVSGAREIFWGNYTFTEDV